jgi:acetyltransferase-like isoleucine patch superfamily enzyme
MIKYIRVLICLVYTDFKFCLIKVIRYKRFKFTLFNIVSPFTEIEIDKSGALTLGRKIRIKSGSKIRVRSGAEVFIGDNTFFNHGCMVTSREKIVIGKDVQMGPNVLIYDHDHDFKKKDGFKNQFYKTSSVIIGDNVWIGANVVILRGTNIGNNCVIGAGSILKGKYNDNTVITQRREEIERRFELI